MRPIRLALPLLAGLALSTPALAAGEMTVASFLETAVALKARGAMALFSSDYKRLKAEGEAAGESYRVRLASERKAGRPSSCPPKGAKVSSDQLLGFLRTYPEPTRSRTTMRAAMADYFISTYPCR